MGEYKMWAIVFRYNESDDTFIGENRYASWASAMDALIEIRNIILKKLDEDDEIGSKPYYPTHVKHMDEK